MKYLKMKKSIIIFIVINFLNLYSGDQSKLSIPKNKPKNKKLLKMAREPIPRGPIQIIDSSSEFYDTKPKKKLCINPYVQTKLANNENSVLNFDKPKTENLSMPNSTTSDALPMNQQNNNIGLMPFLVVLLIIKHANEIELLKQFINAQNITNEFLGNIISLKLSEKINGLMADIENLKKQLSEQDIHKKPENN